MPSTYEPMLKNLGVVHIMEIRQKLYSLSFYHR
jgi:hypothetical protein